ncbi:MAG: sensor histidine kinase, partial [Proteobacteria bacterium]|nr:sensor histidine kinase [Pseudomonadota bacterium]
LRESENRLKEFAGRLINAQEDERRRIARELHDDVNQGLALLTVELEMLARNAVETVAQVREHIQELAEKAKDLSTDIDNLSRRLHPSMLSQLGLVMAIDRLCENLRKQNGIRVNFSNRQIPKRFSDDVALSLYRVAQECLQNATKHSGAQEVRIELIGSRKEILLRICDSGKGFDAGSVADKGLGLISMRERMRILGGEIFIQSQPSHGTRIEARVPLQPSAQRS